MRINPVSSRPNRVVLKDLEASSGSNLQSAPAQGAAADVHIAIPPDGTPVTRSSNLPPDSALPPSIVLQLRQIDPCTGLVVRRPARSSNATWTPENKETIKTMIGQALRDNGGDVSKAFIQLRDKRLRPENYYDTNMAISADYLRARYDTQQYGPKAAQQMNDAYMAFKRTAGVLKGGIGPISPSSKLERKYMNQGIADEKAIMPWSKQKELNRNVIVVGGIPITLGGVQAGANQVKQGVEAGIEQVKKAVGAGIDLAKKSVEAGMDQARKGVEAGLEQARKGAEVGLDHVKKGVDAGLDQLKKRVDKLVHLFLGTSE